MGVPRGNHVPVEVVDLADTDHDRTSPEPGLLRGWRKYLLPVATIILLCATAYHACLTAGFQSDDFYLINRIDREGFYSSWGGPGGNLFLRPGTVLSLLADRAVWGADNPAGFHATNLLLHMTACMLVLAVCRYAFDLAGFRKPGLFSLLTACLFAVLPSHSEAVCWVSGRTDLLATVFGLAATLVFIRGKTVFALLLYLAGILCKESILLLPVIWMALPRANGHGMRFPGDSALALAPAAYLAFRCLATPGFLDGLAPGGQLSSPGWSPGENLFRAAVRTILPPLPSGLETAISQFPPVIAIIPLLVLLALIVIVLVKRKPSRAVATALAVLLVCWLLALAPVLRIKVALFDTQSERLLYFPGVAFLLLSILLLVTLAGEGRLATGVLLAAIAAGCVSTINISRNWSRAGELCSSIAGELSTIPPGCTAIVNLPDNLNGAYVFRNGLEEAVAMVGDARPETSFRVLSTHSVSSSEDAVEARISGDSIRITIPGGERFCSVEGIPMTGREGGTIMLAIPDGAERIFYYSAGSMREMSLP